MSIQQLFFNTPATGPKVVATGGTVYTDGNYKVHIFSSTSTFIVSEVNDPNASLDVLIIGGGYQGVAGESAEYDWDGKPGGAGGAGAYTRLYTGLAFGTYFHATNYTALVAAQNSSNSQLNNDVSGFISTSGQARKLGGNGGNGAVYEPASSSCVSNTTAASAGESGYLNTWRTSFTYGSSGGGGGGGGALDNCLPSNGAAGGTGAGSGNSGGAVYNNGSNGTSATTYGSGGGGGGGAGSDGDEGGLVDGGAGGNGSSGAVIIRYQYQ